MLGEYTAIARGHGTLPHLDVLNFISTLTGQIISWPVAVLILVLALRKPITELLPKLRSWDGPAGKFDFGKGLDAAERSASQAASSVEDEGALHSSNGDSSTSSRSRPTQDAEATSLAREAGANPAFAILTSGSGLPPPSLTLQRHGWTGRATDSARGPWPV